MLFWADSIWGGGDYQLRSALAAKQISMAVITIWGTLDSLPRTTVCSQNINKQFVNIADETLKDYSFLSRYHFTKSKNYLKRRYIEFVTEFSFLLGHLVHVKCHFKTWLEWWKSTTIGAKEGEGRALKA